MAPTYPQFTGSLAPKLKSEILEIAEKLNLKGLETYSKNELMNTVQQFLDQNEGLLSKSEMFKGLYIKRKRNINGRPSEESELDIAGTTRRAAAYAIEATKPTVSSAMNTGKHLANRGVQKIKESGIDPADVPLPDSVRTLRTTANNALEQFEPAADAVSKRILQTAQDTMTLWQKTGKREVLQFLNKSQKTLSNAENIIWVMLFCEVLLLLLTIIPQSEIELQFPPSQFSSNTFARAIYTVFSWAPEVKAKFKIPSSMFSLTPGSEVIKDIIVWVVTTILPPYALAHLITFSKPKTITQHGGRSPRHAAPITLPAFDPLVFALVRLAILLLPLTSAAPDLWRFSLEKMGSIGGRALAAGLTAGFVLADRLGEI